MFIDWIIRISCGAPGKIRPALRPTHRVGFEHLEPRMVMSADFFGYLAGDMAMEAFSHSEPPFGMVDVLSESDDMYNFESDGMVDLTPDLGSLQNPWGYGSDNIFHEAELIYQAMDGPSEVVVEKGDFSSPEFDSLWDLGEYEPENIFSETTFAFFEATPFTFQTFEGPEDDFRAESIELVSLISSEDAIQEGAAIEFTELTKNVNDSYVTYALPQPATLYVGSDKRVFQANSNDSNEFILDKFERFSPASRPGSALESGVSRLKQPVDVNPTHSSHALGMKDEFVDRDGAAQSEIEQQADVGRTSMRQEVEDLLRGLHSPSSRSVEETEKHTTPSDSQISPAISDSHEGGMVLLRATQHSNGNELFVVDEAYAQFGDLFDIRVRMKPAVGAYQAFDVGSRTGPLEHTQNHPVSSTGFSAKHSAKHSRLEDERSGNQTANNESLSTRTGSGFLATGAIAACCTAASRYWRRRR